MDTIFNSYVWNTMNKYFTISIFWLFTTTIFSAPSEQTDEYKELSKELRYEINKPYEKCVGKTMNKIYKEAFKKCEREGSGKNTGGGCAHIAELATTKKRGVPSPTESCDKLKVSNNKIRTIINEEAIKLNIKKN